MCTMEEILGSVCIHLAHRDSGSNFLDRYEAQHEHTGFIILRQLNNQALRAVQINIQKDRVKIKPLHDNSIQDILVHVHRP